VLFVVDLLATDHQHPVLRHCLLDRSNQVLGRLDVEIRTHQFGGEEWMEPPDDDPRRRRLAVRTGRS
jgi:hypothetical protein